MNKNKLVFDIGMHLGEDTGYYLSLGFKVVAVDADPGMVEKAKVKFKSNVLDGSLVVLNYAITSKDGDQVSLNVSEWSFWNSLNKEIANRDNKNSTTIEVPTARLDTLMKSYGVPYYCKVDVEGYDALAAGTLLNSDFRPEYISLETECIGKDERIDDKKALETLDVLHKLGYTKFKLVDQSTLVILDSKQSFYGNKLKPKSWLQNIKVALGFENLAFIDPAGEISRIKKKFNYDFATYASGPFGKDLKGNWVDYESAKAILLFHREDYFKQKDVKNYSFWCDWHATK